MSEPRFRAPMATDAPAVTAVINARERADRGRAEVSVEMIVAQWSEREIELAVDGRVAVALRRVVGYALVTRDHEFVNVSPAHEGASTGSALLRWTMARTAERPLPMHRQIVGAGNAAAAALLRGAGYTRGAAITACR